LGDIHAHREVERLWVASGPRSAARRRRAAASADRTCHARRGRLRARTHTIARAVGQNRAKRDDLQRERCPLGRVVGIGRGQRGGSRARTWLAVAARWPKP
jgi:hypothetical protein